MTCRRCEGLRFIRVTTWMLPELPETNLEVCPACTIWMKVDQAEHIGKPRQGMPNLACTIYELRDAL